MSRSGDSRESQPDITTTAMQSWQDAECGSFMLLSVSMLGKTKKLNLYVEEGGPPKCCSGGRENPFREFWIIRPLMAWQCLGVEVEGLTLTLSLTLTLTLTLTLNITLTMALT